MQYQHTSVKNSLIHDPHRCLLDKKQRVLRTKTTIRIEMIHPRRLKTLFSQRIKTRNYYETLTRLAFSSLTSFTITRGCVVILFLKLLRTHETHLSPPPETVIFLKPIRSVLWTFDVDHVTVVETRLALLTIIRTIVLIYVICTSNVHIGISSLLGESGEVYFFNVPTTTTTGPWQAYKMSTHTRESDGDTREQTVTRYFIIIID